MVGNQPYHRDISGMVICGYSREIDLFGGFAYVVIF